ncbi:polyprotein [Alaria esculenta RNA virus 1]|uniref:Polyprotein n=1 Tax=Alaria esculenta RNA virus 1 TaxID=3153340 RepID=A0AB38ZN62_9VIRU
MTSFSLKLPGGEKLSQALAEVACYPANVQISHIERKITEDLILFSSDENIASITDACNYCTPHIEGSVIIEPALQMRQFVDRVSKFVYRAHTSTTLKEIEELQSSMQNLSMSGNTNEQEDFSFMIVPGKRGAYEIRKLILTIPDLSKSDQSHRTNLVEHIKFAATLLSINTEDIKVDRVSSLGTTCPLPAKLGGAMTEMLTLHRSSTASAAVGQFKLERDLRVTTGGALAILAHLHKRSPFYRRDGKGKYVTSELLKTVVNNAFGLNESRCSQFSKSFFKAVFRAIVTNDLVRVPSSFSKSAKVTFDVSSPEGIMRKAGYTPLIPDTTKMLLVLTTVDKLDHRLFGSTGDHEEIEDTGQKPKDPPATEVATSPPADTPKVTFAPGTSEDDKGKGKASDWTTVKKKNPSKKDRRKKSTGDLPVGPKSNDKPQGYVMEAPAKPAAKKKVHLETISKLDSARNTHKAFGAGVKLLLPFIDPSSKLSMKDQLKYSYKNCSEQSLLFFKEQRNFVASAEKTYAVLQASKNPKSKATAEHYVLARNRMCNSLLPMKFADRTGTCYKSYSEIPLGVRRYFEKALSREIQERPKSDDIIEPSLKKSRVDTVDMDVTPTTPDTEMEVPEPPLDL